MSTWLYMNGSAQMGPVSTDELRGLLAKRTIAGTTMVWRDGLTAWAAANTLPEFAGSVPPPPPPLASSLAAGSLATAGPPGVFVPDPADVEKNKVFGILSYLPPFLFLVPILAAKESKFALYHANQGLVLTLAAFAFGVISMLLSFILAFIPFVGWLMALLIHFGGFFAIIALVVIGLMNAINGQCKPLPVIGDRFTLVK